MKRYILPVLVIIALSLIVLGALATNGNVQGRTLWSHAAVHSLADGIATAEALRYGGAIIVGVGVGLLGLCLVAFVVRNIRSGAAFAVLLLAALSVPVNAGPGPHAGDRSIYTPRYWIGLSVPERDRWLAMDLADKASGRLPGDRCAARAELVSLLRREQVDLTRWSITGCPADDCSKASIEREILAESHTNCP